MRFRAALPAACALLLAAAPAKAADIKSEGALKVGEIEYTKISLSGEILEGDAKKLEAELDNADEAIVWLNSLGGSFSEALKIAALLQDNLAGTIVEGGASCLSACAVAFLGGSAQGEEGDTTPSRSIAVNAQLAFHAPDLAVADTGLTKQSAQTAMKAVTDFVRMSGDFGIEAKTAADLMTAEPGQAYAVNTAYRLGRVGVEVQKLSPPADLTMSMVRNLCTNGWSYSEDATDAETDKAIKDTGWKPETATFPIKSDYFGEGVEAHRTLLPFDLGGEGVGYYFCLVDHAKTNGVEDVDCRGFVFAEKLEDAVALARKFGDETQGDQGTPDIECDIPSVFDPLSADFTSAENRWALVPAETPIGEITKVLDGYRAKEPVL